jgi:hypothetical protein
MREKSGEQRKRISVSGFYPRSIRGVKSDRLLADIDAGREHPDVGYFVT